MLASDQLLLRRLLTYCMFLPTALKEFYQYSKYNIPLAPCLDPGVPSSGSRSGDDFRHAKSVDFTCKEKYELIGASTISCNDGKWTSKAPICKGKYI